LEGGGAGDAEHVAEGAEDAAGLGGGAEEFGQVGMGEEILELAGQGGGVADGDREPGAAGGEKGFRARRADTAGPGGAWLGQGAGTEAGKEIGEARGRAGEAGPDEDKQGGMGEGVGRGRDIPGRRLGAGIAGRRIGRHILARRVRGHILARRVGGDSRAEGGEDDGEVGGD